MNSISEPWLMKVLFRLTPISICLGQYFVTIMLTLMLVVSDCSWEVIIIIAFVVFISGVMLPFWYKTFFVRTFVGVDRPLLVQWSDEVTRFRGAHFDIEVPNENILGYKVVGFRRTNTAFTLKVKLRKKNGAVESMWLSTTMPRKKEFMDFLDQHRAIE
jgi:hypothetical protein